MIRKEKDNFKIILIDYLIESCDDLCKLEKQKPKK